MIYVSSYATIDHLTNGNAGLSPRALAFLELTSLSPGEYHVANFDATLLFFGIVPSGGIVELYLALSVCIFVYGYSVGELSFV